MGGAIALRLAEEGADVVVNDRVAGRTDGIERDIRAMGRDVVAVHANVTRREGAAAVIDAALDQWGRVDILVNVVGGMKGPHERAIWEITEEEWELAMGLNLRGTFHCTQLACRPMMERRQGKIVNIASVSWAGEPMHAHYAAAKAGVVAFTRSVATQLAPYDINVNAVAPGATLSSIEGAPDRSGVGTPLGRVNEPRDIAEAVLFLVSEEARNVSGQLLTVAGGANPAL
jgi:NAD(P)-dependent dehydrogenase (short-subunit alcohol dehydrogenase family)